MKKRILSLLLALVMVLSLAACASTGTEAPKTTDAPKQDAPKDDAPQETVADVTQSEFYGPIYDEWSEMTDEELYELAKKEVEENGPINIYATSSKMLKEEEPFEELYAGLDVEVMDLDSDEVLEKCVLEANAQNVQGDVLQTKDVNGNVFFNYYEEGYVTTFYPKDICAHIDESMLHYGFPLYASQAFWYYNTEAFPDGQPVTNWWQIIERKEDGTQKYRLFTKEIGTETAYLSLFASFIVNADQMEQAYKDLYGTDLEYTYDGSGFEFDVPENNAGIEYLWRFSQMQMQFISDGDDLVEAVHNSTADDPALCLASAGKIENQEKSGFNIGWLTGLAPYTGLLNQENLYVVANCKHPAGARLFIRFITGGADGQSGGLKPFTKQGNWPVRDDVEDKKNPATLDECGAVPSDLAAINDVYLDTQDLWIYWLSISPYTK